MLQKQQHQFSNFGTNFFLIQFWLPVLLSRGNNLGAKGATALSSSLTAMIALNDLNLRF